MQKSSPTKHYSNGYRRNAEANSLVWTEGHFGSPRHSPASVLPIIPSGSSPLTFQFQWRPACSSIRYRPFDAIFKAADNGSPYAFGGYEKLEYQGGGASAKKM
jgi:hypothetical protein